MPLQRLPAVLRRSPLWIPADRSVPPGAPVARVDGPDPDRVLVVGSGPVSGAGAGDHERALPGTVARALSDRTGHGAVVEARGGREVRLADLPGLLDGAQLQRFDALVLVIGLFDATDGMGRRRWAKELHRHLDAIRRDGTRDAAVLLTRIPPFSAVSGRRGLSAARGDRAVARLNGVIEEAARTRPSTGRTVLPSPSSDAPLGSSAWYERCGEAIGEALTPMLASQRAR